MSTIGGDAGIEMSWGGGVVEPPLSPDASLTDGLFLLGKIAPLDVRSPM